MRSCVERLPKMGSFTELIFVDDGSNDGTSEKVKECTGLRNDIEARLVALSSNHGKGFAVRASSGPSLVKAGLWVRNALYNTAAVAAWFTEGV